MYNFSRSGLYEHSMNKVPQNIYKSTTKFPSDVISAPHFEVLQKRSPSLEQIWIKPAAVFDKDYQLQS